VYCVNVGEKDGKHRESSDENLNSKGRAKSDTGVTAERWRHQGANRYSKQAKSDSGVVMIEKIPVELKASTSIAMMSNKGEQKKEEVEKSDHYQGEFEFSPEKSLFTDNHGHEHDHCAATTIRTITTTTTYNSSMSAAMVQSAADGHSIGVGHPPDASKTGSDASCGEALVSSAATTAGAGRCDRAQWLLRRSP
jgi:hypothetical protein